MLLSNPSASERFAAGNGSASTRAASRPTQRHAHGHGHYRAHACSNSKTIADDKNRFGVGAHSSVESTPRAWRFPAVHVIDSLDRHDRIQDAINFKVINLDADDDDAFCSRPSTSCPLHLVRPCWRQVNPLRKANVPANVPAHGRQQPHSDRAQTRQRRTGGKCVEGLTPAPHL